MRRTGAGGRRRIPPVAYVALGLLLGACATVRPTGVSTSFRYAVPPSPVTYEVTDTTRLFTGGEPTPQVEAGYRAVTRLTFHREGGDLRVSVRFVTLEGRYEVPGRYVASLGPDDVPEPIEVVIAPDGDIRDVALPSLSDDYRRIAGTDGIVRSLFAHLPETPVGPGSSWEDTVHVTERVDQTTTTGTSFITSTWAADSLVDGRPLHVIRTSAGTAVTVDGVTEGIRFQQRMMGATEGTVLWDPTRGLMAERSEQGTLSGAINAPGGGRVQDPVRAVVRRSVRRIPDD